MGNQSDVLGRAYEYACIKSLFDYLSSIRKCVIVQNQCFINDLENWNSLDSNQQDTMRFSSKAAVKALTCLEPLLADDGMNDVLELLIQPDSKGEEGDVRDILLIRKSINWEIGLSIKHNHFAVKHSRLGKTLDFGEKWFGHKCSNTYWSAVSAIFMYLNSMKDTQQKWSDIEDKQNEIYVPILKAFIDEVKHQNEIDKAAPKRMVEYLLGEFDFYKIISLDSKRLTQIESFNLHGHLNKPSSNSKPEIEIALVELPTKIVSIDFKENSQTTVEMIMNNGWQFSFRIHNASTYVETSLKFDIQIVGLPTNIVCLNCPWDD